MERPSPKPEPSICPAMSVGFGGNVDYGRYPRLRKGWRRALLVADFILSEAQSPSPYPYPALSQAAAPEHSLYNRRSHISTAPNPLKPRSLPRKPQPPLQAFGHFPYNLLRPLCGSLGSSFSPWKPLPGRGIFICLGERSLPGPVLHPSNLNNHLKLTSL